MTAIYRILWLCVAILLILLGVMSLLVDDGIRGGTITLFVIGFALLIWSIVSGTRRFFSDPEDDFSEETKEIIKDIAWRSDLRFGIRHYGFLGTLFKKNSIDHRPDERKRRVDAANRKLAAKSNKETDQALEQEDVTASSSQPVETITDYWTLPKTGPKVTVLNSAWTWTGLVYLFILLAVVFAALQQGLELFNGGWMGLVIVIGMLYPAWRIGSLISRFMKKRGIGTSFDMPFSGSASSDTGAQDPVKARMAERKARVEQARKDGKL